MFFFAAFTRKTRHPDDVNEPAMYSYAKLGEDALTVSLFDDGRKAAIGDPAAASGNCSTIDAYCIRSEEFIVAIPYGRSADIPSGLALVERRRIDARLLGVRAEVRVVDAQAGDVKYCY
ncbi:hypothetical protein [Tahibacter caeni]|uniref:hypothetical protein n=1 Tax=Tahibacter caeni TaxID=1453545 RepID=UPI0021476392|nr:hypothetical protein [Tahibacter caeni]